MVVPWALIACWPLAVGQISQRLVADGMEQLQQRGYEAEIVSYDRGYFSSDAVTRYAVIDPKTKQQLEN